MRGARGTLTALALATALLVCHPTQAHEPTSGRDCSGYPYAAPFSSAPASYVPRYHTVAHEFLAIERGVGPVTPSEYAILDALIGEAKGRLKPIPAGLSGDAYDAFAVESLKTIDCILVSHGFVYPGIGLVQLLSDGLDPTRFDDPHYYRALLDSPHNAGRAVFIEARKPGPYYVVDCDIASYLYLAIGEILMYPLAMVDMPAHNFIRWLRPDGTYIDFETMDGIQTDNEYYVTRWGIPRGFVGAPGVLTTMTSPQLLAYEHFLVGVAYSWKHDYPHMLQSYEKAVSVDDTLADSLNNLAWYYTVVPEANLRDAHKAVSYAQRATAILADGDGLDTLACAYGLAGDFAQAVATEDRAKIVDWAPQGSDVEGDARSLAAAQLCEDPGFGVDPHPFRPSQPARQGIIKKDSAR
jgi:hypothetical protein